MFTSLPLKIIHEKNMGIETTGSFDINKCEVAGLALFSKFKDTYEL